MIKRYLFVILLLVHTLYATLLPQSIKYSEFINTLVLYDGQEPDETESQFLYFFEKEKGSLLSFRKDSDKISKIEMKNYTFVIYDDDFLGVGMLFDNNGTMTASLKVSASGCVEFTHPCSTFVTPFSASNTASVHQ